LRPPGPHTCNTVTSTRACTQGQALAFGARAVKRRLGPPRWSPGPWPLLPSLASPSSPCCPPCHHLVAPSSTTLGRHGKLAAWPRPPWALLTQAFSVPTQGTPMVRRSHPPWRNTAHTFQLSSEHLAGAPPLCFPSRLGREAQELSQPCMASTKSAQLAT
jgi:hypothetical protein